MKRLVFLLILIFLLAHPVSALEFTVPDAPREAGPYLPDPATDFGAGLWTILKRTVDRIHPELRDTSQVCLSVGCCVVILSVMKFFPGGSSKAVELGTVVGIALLLMNGTESLIGLAAETLTEISEYGKLFFPVLAAAMAAQGRPGSSAALYSGTMVCNMVLSSLVSGVLIPVMYLYLAIAVASAMTQHKVLEKMLNSVKNLVIWGLKVILYGFTGFMALTGAISGTTDATALKVTRMAISSMVPVVGGILSGASEAVVIGAATAKNAAGIYGMYVFIALCAGPFLRIGVRYLLLKLTGIFCVVFDCKQPSTLIDHFTEAMGLLLAMTGTECLMMIISITCFLKGVGV